MVTPILNTEIDSRLTDRDLVFVLEDAIKARGFVSHCVDSFNEFAERGMKQIITKQFAIETPITEYKRVHDDRDKTIKTVALRVEFTDATLLRPEYITQFGTSRALMPHDARHSNRTYSGVIEVDALIKYTAKFADGHEETRTDTVSGFKIGKIPVMIGSVACHTHELTREELIRYGEDPSDPGGIFIVKRIERAIESNESLIYNAAQIFKRRFMKEEARCEFISKPGDAFENSFEVKIRSLQNGAITCEMTTSFTREIEIPFYIIFRMLGMMTDIDLMQTIILQKCHTITDQGAHAPRNRSTDAITASLYKSIHHALHIKDSLSAYGPEFETIKYSNNREEIFTFMSDLINRHMQRKQVTRRDTKLAQYNNDMIQKLLDEKFLPHCGTTPDARVKKCWYLGHLIRDLKLVEMGAAKSTDRDSIIIKRLHTPGYAYSKEFKKLLASSLISPAKKAFTDLLPGQSFYTADLKGMFASAVKGAQLEKAMIASIKAVASLKQEQKSRLSIAALERKNKINTLAAMRVITTPNKSMAQQSDRAYAMRAVHPTYTGYICPNASVDTGAMVGLNKQIAIATIITSATSSSMLTNILLDDKELVIPLLQMAIDSILDANKIFVNGDFVGYTMNPSKLVTKYRMARRLQNDGDLLGGKGTVAQPPIDRHTTIVWDTYKSTVYFYVDAGRMLRPMIVVNNNLDQLDLKSHADIETKYRQWISITKDDVYAMLAGKLRFADLEARGAIEYISAEEQTNCWVALNFDTLIKNAHNVTYQYTHLQWPQSMLSIAMLTAPFPDHSESSRCCYQTGHGKSACGWFALNWPLRSDKMTFWQFACEMPLVTTIMNRHTMPNGQNCIVAMLSYTGANMEDALIINGSSVDRLMFAGIAFHFESSEREKEEDWGVPDPNITHDMKQHANYSKLLPEGYPRVGTMISYGDVVIGKIQTIHQPQQGSQYTKIDKSVIYKKQEDAVVTQVVKDIDQDNKEFIRVKLETVRLVQKGDKYSSRAGNKGVIGQILSAQDMPYGEISGVRPDLIYNPHCMPKRMMINQLLESTLAKISATFGCINDATAFTKTNIKWMKEQAEAVGIKYLGCERLINGMTGQLQEAMVFMCPLYIQHLKRFIVDSVYVANTGATSAITHQPVSGKKQGGSLRHGEQETHVTMSHGAIATMLEKFFLNSDGVDIPVCRNCGQRALVNSRNYAKCATCQDRADIVNVGASWSVNLLWNTLQGMGVGMKLGLDPHTIE